jgi:D-erythronate 2-dehydrogenase
VTHEPSRALIVGGGGMLGRMLAARLVAEHPAAHVLSVDLSAPPSMPGVVSAALDIVRADLAPLVLSFAPDTIFHLAAVVSGQAEADFDLGYAVNVDGTRRLLEATRASGLRPRFVFASSLAVYGGKLPELVPDDLAPSPRSSYGAQKAIGELLVADYARKGHIDGVAIRLPTVMVRPGAPNRAASGFLSAIVREPLAGHDAVLPVPGDTGVWVASLEIAVATLLHAARLPRASPDDSRVIVGRGISTTPDAILAALKDVAGEGTVSRVRREHDSAVAAIVSTWPRAFACVRAEALGFPVDRDIASIVRAYAEGSAACASG